MKAKSQNMLDRVYTAAPCSMTWESMSGNDRVRTCHGCEHSVWNLSDMSTKEAESFLQKNGVSHCTIFYRRKDGTIMTDNCPVGLRGLRNQYRQYMHIAAGILGFLLGVPAAIAQQSDKEPCNLPGQMIALPPPENETIPGEIPPLKGNASNKGKILFPTEVLETDGAGKKSARLKAKISIKADTTALTFYLKGQENEKNGNFLVAEVYYKQALRSIKCAQGTDWKFRELIENDLHNLQEKYRSSAEEKKEAGKVRKNGSLEAKSKTTARR